jgi:hypothetical protein
MSSQQGQRHRGVVFHSESIYFLDWKEDFHQSSELTHYRNALFIDDKADPKPIGSIVKFDEFISSLPVKHIVPSIIRNLEEPTETAEAAEDQLPKELFEDDVIKLIGQSIYTAQQNSSNSPRKSPKKENIVVKDDSCKETDIVVVPTAMSLAARHKLIETLSSQDNQIKLVHR